MDHWTVYALIKDHLENLRLMLERCRQHQIALNSKKCIFCAPFKILLGHIICKQWILVDPANIALIISLAPPTNTKVLRATLGHAGYYRKFIFSYAAITAPMDKLLKKNSAFIWCQECQTSFDSLNTKMDSAPILVFPNWTKDFHVHVDASSVALGVVLTQPR